MFHKKGAGNLDFGAEPFAGFIRMLQIQNMSDPRDRLKLRQSRGKMTFSADRSYISIDMVMYDEEDKEDGSHQGVLHSLFTSAQEIIAVPAMPTGPMNEPVGPVPHVPPNSQAKSIWTFGDGSSLTAVGPSANQLVLLNDGSSIFLVTGAQIVTHGTGRFEGAHGVTQSLGAAHITAGRDFLGRSMSNAVEYTSFESFRIVERRDYGTLKENSTSTAPPAHQAGPQDAVHTG